MPGSEPDLWPLTLQLDADDAEPTLEEKEGQDEYSQLQMPVWPAAVVVVGRFDLTDSGLHLSSFISISDLYPVAEPGELCTLSETLFL